MKVKTNTIPDRLEYSDFEEFLRNLATVNTVNIRRIKSGKGYSDPFVDEWYVDGVPRPPEWYDDNVKWHESFMAPVEEHVYTDDPEEMVCPCGYAGPWPLSVHLSETHRPEDFGLSPLGVIDQDQLGYEDPMDEFIDDDAERVEAAD